MRSVRILGVALLSAAVLVACARPPSPGAAPSNGGDGGMLDGTTTMTASADSPEDNPGTPTSPRLPSPPSPGATSPTQAVASVGSSIAAPDSPVPDVTGQRWYLLGIDNTGIRTNWQFSDQRWFEITGDSITINSACRTAHGTASTTGGVLRISGVPKPDPDAKCEADQIGDAVGLIAELDGKTLHAKDNELWIGEGQGVVIFSTEKPKAPAIPTSADLSFLPAATTTTARQTLTTPLTGRWFVATAATSRTLISDPERGGVSLSFGVNQVGIGSGCNGGGGPYSLNGKQFTVAEIAATAMLCTGPLGDQETWFWDLLRGGSTYSLNGKTLTLTAGKQVVTFTETEPKPVQQAYTFLHLDEIVTSDGAHPLPRLEKTEYFSRVPEISIDGDQRQLSFNTGCAQMASTYTGALPTIEPGVFTGDALDGCPPLRSQLDAALRYILSGPITVKRDGLWFTITGRDGITLNAHVGMGTLDSP